MRFGTSALAVVALPLLSACEGLRPADSSVAPGRAGADAIDHERSAIAAIRAGDLDTAADHLDELRFTGELSRAQASLAAGDPEDALAAVDRALRIHPQDEASLWIKAEGSALLATRMIERSMGAQFVEGAYLDSLNAYAALPASAKSRTGASEAALNLGRAGTALEFAREARDLAAAEGPERAAAQTAWAKGAYRSYVAQLSFENDPETGSDLGVPADALFNEADEALNQLAAWAPEDPWTWLALGDLMLWAGLQGEAATRFASGLDHHPSDAVLVERLRGALAAGGQDALVAGLAEVAGRIPSSAPLGLALGTERTRGAVARIKTDPAVAAEAFATAEAELSRARAADEALTSACLGWEVIARAGQGWCAYEAADFDAATALFLTMEDVFEGGMAWSLGSDLRSGVDGLWFVADQHHKAGDWEAGAEVYETLSDYQPDDANWANNAGFLCRDAAVELEILAGAMCAAAAGEVDDAELLALLHQEAGVAEDLAGTEAAAVLLRDASDQLLERAWDLAGRSLTAYQRASFLAPDDVRIVNDTALVAVYYLHVELEEAERLLESAIAKGAEQLAAAEEGSLELTDEARRALEEAWGDAYQNMGVLELIHRRDPAAALPWFERSVEIGPVPRPLLTQNLIPFCRGELEAPLERLMPETRWGAPCSQR